MSVCPHCDKPMGVHDEAVNDLGQVVRYCPTRERIEPASVDAAKAHIARIRAQLREDR